MNTFVNGYIHRYIIYVYTGGCSHQTKCYSRYGTIWYRRGYKWKTTGDSAIVVECVRYVTSGDANSQICVGVCMRSKSQMFMLFSCYCSFLLIIVHLYVFYCRLRHCHSLCGIFNIRWVNAYAVLYTITYSYAWKTPVGTHTTWYMINCTFVYVYLHILPFPYL